MIERVLFVVLYFGLATGISGCGEDQFSGECSLCAQGVPVGPSADEQSCEAWGDTFGCTTAVLTNPGMCDADARATCTVTDCRTGVFLCERPVE